MSRRIRNTLSVLAVTAVTAAAIFSAGQLVGAATDAASGSTVAAALASASSGGTLQTCPRTGCTASTCHGATGSPPPSGYGYGAQRGQWQ